MIGMRIVYGIAIRLTSASSSSIDRIPADPATCRHPSRNSASTL
jgi:hypothetical protein